MNLKRPKPSEPFLDARGLVTRPWFNYLSDLSPSEASATIAEQLQALEIRVTELEDTGGSLPKSTMAYGVLSVQSNGTLAGGVVVFNLVNDVQAPGNTLYYGTGPDGLKGWFNVSDAIEVEDGQLTKAVGEDGVTTLGLAEVADSGTGALLAIERDEFGRVTGTRDATITGTAGEIDVADGDASAGLPTIGLADLANAGGGAIRKFDRDAKGRVSGTSEATTDDLAEGAENLYFTDARADARVNAQKGQSLGLATLDANSKLDAGQLPALAITETFVVADEAEMLALDVQQGDVAVREDLQATFILTAEPATTLSNWQELLVPTGVGVASFNGRTGTVTPQTGDYTAAQVGAATAAQGTLADTSIQPGDARLTDAREWTASTVSQLEAETGTATTRRAWTAQRVRQAIVAWWSGSADKTKLDGIAPGAQVNVATNLAQGTRTTTTVPVTSSTGTSATLAAATTSLAGVMASADKTKLDGIASGAQVNVATNLSQGTRTSTAVPINSSTGSGATLDVATGSLAGVMAAADKTKVDGLGNGALVYMSASQSIPNSATTVAIFGALAYSDTGYFSIGTPDRLTIPANGRYIVSFCAVFDASSVGIRTAVITKNGTSFVGRPVQRILPTGQADYVTAMSAAVDCVAGDYFQMTANQTSGGALNLLGGVASTWLSIQRVS